MLALLIPCFAGLAAFLLLASESFSFKKMQGFAAKTKALQILTWVGSSKLIFLLQKIRGWQVCQKELQLAVAKQKIQLTDEQAGAALAFLLCFASFCVSIVAGNLWLLAPFCLLAPFLTIPYAKHLEEKKREAMQKALPDAYRSLAGSLTSGQTLPQAMGYVGRHVGGEVGMAFNKAELTFRCGGSLADSLSVIESSLKDSSCELLICALAVSQKTGAPLAHLLHQAAELVEEKESLKKLLQTKTAQARMSVQVVMLLPVVIVLGLALLSPDFQHGLLTSFGIFSVGVSAALDVFAFYVMKRIVKGVSFG